MKKLAKMALGLGFTLSAMAPAVQAQVTCNGTTFCEGPASELIGGLFPFDRSGTPEILIESRPTVDGTPGCIGAGGGPNVRLNDSAVFRESYAALLTAVATDAVVTIRLDTTEAECTVGFVRLRAGS